MVKSSLEALNADIAKAQKVTVSFNSGINENTRCGSYISLRKGMVSVTYFVGKDLVSGEDIVECLM